MLRIAPISTPEPTTPTPIHTARPAYGFHRAVANPRDSLKLRRGPAYSAPVGAKRTIGTIPRRVQSNREGIAPEYLLRETKCRDPRARPLYRAGRVPQRF